MGFPGQSIVYHNERITIDIIIVHAHQNSIDACKGRRRLSVFDRIFTTLSEKAGRSNHLMIDATHLKAQRTVAFLLKRGFFLCHVGRTKDGLNSKLHAVRDGEGRPVRLYLTVEQVGVFIANATYVADGIVKPIMPGKLHNSHLAGKATKPSPARWKDQHRYGTRFIG
ncbi:hypothetical protein [Acetobacter sp.]|uniref:hypothetical protein n=1 Tax=Acetobacter sp. TaxID=440 RepID=UPI0039E88D33